MELPTPYKDAPAFDFYPERWLAGVAEFSDNEQLAYLRLLCFQWLQKGLPAELKKLRGMAGRGVTDDLLRKFPVDEDGMRRNPRLEVVRAEQRARIERKREQRRNAANKRWHPESNATAMRPHNDGIADAMPTTHHSPPTTHPLKQQQQQQPARGFQPPSLAEARDYAARYSKGNAEMLDIPMPVVTQWHDDRESIGWETVKGGTPIPITDWQADLRKYARAYAKNDRALPPGTSLPRNGHASRERVVLTAKGWGGNANTTTTTTKP